MIFLIRPYLFTIYKLNSNNYAGKICKLSFLCTSNGSADVDVVVQRFRCVRAQFQAPSPMVSGPSKGTLMLSSMNARSTQPYTTLNNLNTSKSYQETLHIHTKKFAKDMKLLTLLSCFGPPGFSRIGAVNIHRSVYSVSRAIDVDF